MKKEEIKIKAKAVSVNQCWQGRRFKTQRYKDYEEELFYLLPKKISIPEGKLQLSLLFGVSSKLSDNDNMVKPFQDIISKRYDFNDNRIYKTINIKKDVEKGDEFISFSIEKYVEK